MSFLDAIRAGLRRVDVRAASHLVLLFAPLVASLLFALYLFAASEFLELATFELEDRLARLEEIANDADAGRRSAELSRFGSDLARAAGGFRVVDARGTVRLSGGEMRSAAPDGSVAAGLLGSIRLAETDDLVAERTLASGERLEVFVSSADFVRERDEMLSGFWLTLTVGIALVALVAIPATWLSLAPLRHATRVTGSLDPRSLSARLPTRGTRDDIDRHAGAVNRLLDQIEAGFSRLQAFSQDVAHELRTPVHRILNLTELRLLDRAVDEPTRSELEAIHRTADQMAHLVDGLLLLARGEADSLALRREAVDVGRLLRTLEEMYGPVCEQASIRLLVESESAFVSGDSALLLRALGNLVDNALVHTPPDGSIRLRTAIEASEPRWVRLEVEDSGPGIPREARDRIFDRFVRLPEAPRVEGVGLGLPIARAIVRAHGGDLELADPERSESGQSEPGRPGPGACFVVRLPCLAPDAGA